MVEARTLIPGNRFHVHFGAWNTLVSVTEITTDEDGDGTFEVTWSSSDYQLLTDDDTPNVNAAPEPEPYTKVRAVGTHDFPLPTGGKSRRDLLRIDGTWGWKNIPTAVEEACLILAEETFKLRDAPFGVAGFGEFGAIRVTQNPKAAKMLARYMPVAVI